MLPSPAMAVNPLVALLAASRRRRRTIGLTGEELVELDKRPGVMGALHPGVRRDRLGRFTREPDGSTWLRKAAGR